MCQTRSKLADSSPLQVGSQSDWPKKSHGIKVPKLSKLKPKKYFKVVYISKLIVYIKTSQMSDTKYSLTAKLIHMYRFAGPKGVSALPIATKCLEACLKGRMKMYPIHC